MRIGRLHLTRRGDALMLVAAIATGIFAGVLVDHHEKGLLNVQTHLPNVLHVDRPVARVGVASSTRGSSARPVAHRGVPASHRSRHGVRSGRSYARTLVVDRQQFACLDVLWSRESHWNAKAKNAHSTAAGIPQLLGLSTHLSASKQVDAGLRYIAHRYGTPCAALRHSNVWGWY